LFWKKSHSEPLNVEFDSDRMDYRVVPDKNDPVILQVEGKLLRVVDISAGGVSCISNFLQAGKTYSVRINLPDEYADVRCGLEVIRQDADQSYHCSFINMDSVNVDRFHRYVLERQKTSIKSVRDEIK
jgi:hypothetical protein